LRASGEVLVAVNGRIKVFDENGVLGALNTTTDSFVASVRTAGTSDPHVRDRLSGDKKEPSRGDAPFYRISSRRSRPVSCCHETPEHSRDAGRLSARPVGGYRWICQPRSGTVPGVPALSTVTPFISHT
jgi:hypothetical protein